MEALLALVPNILGYVLVGFVMYVAGYGNGIHQWQRSNQNAAARDGYVVKKTKSNGGCRMLGFVAMLGILVGVAIFVFAQTFR